MLCYILFIVNALLALISACPPRQQIYPCMCPNEFQMLCPGLENDHVLSDVVTALRNWNSYIDSFIIEKSNFMYIPNDIFINLKFKEFQIVESSFMALTDTDIAFKGLEDDLRSLKITDSDMLNTWDWMVLKNLKSLLDLQIEAGLTFVSEDIQQLTAIHLQAISLAKNQITYIHETAFANFKELYLLSLQKNLISEIKRSMFPNPADLLWKLNLGHNEIQSFPSDIFEDMPSLQILIVESNRLMTLNEGTFKPVWSQLAYFDVMDNRLRCDCRMTWLSDLVLPQIIHGVCEQPKNLQEKKLQELIPKDLWCFHYVN